MDVTRQKLLIDSQQEELARCYEIISTLRMQKSILLKELHDQVMAENKRKLAELNSGVNETKEILGIAKIDGHTMINVGEFGCPKDENGNPFKGNKISVVFKDGRIMTTAYPSEMGFWDLHPAHPRRPTYYKVFTE